MSRKLIFLFFLFLTLISCQNNVVKIPNANYGILEGKVKLSQIKQKEIKLDSFTAPKPEYIQIEYNWHHLIKNVNLYQFSKLLSNYEVFKIMPFFNAIHKIDPMRPENNYFNYSNIVFKIKNDKKK